MSPSADIISTLPDILLHHILSFIPAKEAAATIILSKRWKPLWFSQRILKLTISPILLILQFNWMFKTSALISPTHYSLLLFF
jgi:hypothetical protein